MPRNAEMSPWPEALLASILAVTTMPNAHASLTYLALGDSYTIGEGVPAQERWPMQYVAALRKSGEHIADPQIIARTGWTTDELSAAIDTAKAHGELHAGYDLVTLSIGVNNQYRGRDIANYRKEFSALLERAIALARGRHDHVLVLSIPDWGVTPFARSSGRDRAQIARELDAFNAAAEQICTAHDVAWMDITPLTREAGAEPAMLADDGLHPSGAMYARWVELITDTLP